MYLAIPRSLAPTPEQRDEIERYILRLQDAYNERNIDRSMTAVTKLLLALSDAAVSEAQATARAEAFILVLRDLPTFAVIEACRRWLLGKVTINDGNGQPRRPNFSFPPKPPELRLVAEPIAAIALSRIHRLQKLMMARVIDDDPPPPPAVQRTPMLAAAEGEVEIGGHGARAGRGAR